MTTFDSQTKIKEFLSLDAKRGAGLVELKSLKAKLESLSKENPSVRPFERIEAKLDEELDQLKIASKAVSSYLVKMGCDLMNDSCFQQYCTTADEIAQAIDTLRDDYHMLLESKGLLQQQSVAAPVSQSELASALKATC